MTGTKDGLSLLTAGRGILDDMDHQTSPDTSPESAPDPAPDTAPDESHDTAVLPPWQPVETAPVPGPAASRSGRGKFAVTVVTASLLLGGAAGVGGAAAWDTWKAPAATNLSSNAATNSTLADNVSAPAPAGSVQEVAQKVLPSVAKIDVRGSGGSGSGSGIVLSADGQILTNNHVVELAEEGGSITVSFSDGSSANATVLGTDPLTDTAVIQAEDVSGLTPASIGRSADLAVGQGVVAIGSPFGLDATVTSGIVSALNRPVSVGSDGNGNTTTYPAIQTDAAINPGNSGGPLTDMGGQVIGINSSIRTATSSAVSSEAGSIGLGFAIPIDEVMPIVEQMSKGETPTHARLGISVSSVSPNAPAEARADQAGARIEKVSPGSTAESAGLATGDVIVRVDDELITGSDSLVATIRSYRPGDTVTVNFVRDGETQTAQLELDSDADSDDS